jgi:hypothetical protein
VQLASCLLEWHGAGRAGALVAGIRSTPAAPPALEGAARAAALLALHVLLPDALGPWMHALTVPCSVAAGAAAAARWAPAPVGRLLSGAAARAASWMAAQGAGGGAARPGEAGRAGGGGLLAAGRAAAWAGLFLHQQLQSVSGGRPGGWLAALGAVCLGGEAAALPPAAWGERRQARHDARSCVPACIRSSGSSSPRLARPWGPREGLEP